MGSKTGQRVLADTDWDSIIERRVDLLGNLIAHSLDWNMYCGEKMVVTGLERLVDAQHLILSNKPGRLTGPTWRKTTLIIHLSITTLEVGALHT